MIQGTRILEGTEAKAYQQTIDTLRGVLLKAGYEEIVFSSLWEQDTFIKRAGQEITNQMYVLDDKDGRPICLIPEVTAVVEDMWKEVWSKSKPHPFKIFYVARCYRHEANPQEGRYREFTQFGVEILGGEPIYPKLEINSIMAKCLKPFNLHYNLVPAVKRGLTYYTTDGFEVECPELGEQKQVLGGGAYESGIGFGIGIDRLMLAMPKKLGGGNSVA